jgi:hypothetical protein
MSQRVWLVGVMAVALGVVAIVTERSQSQEENSQRDPFANEASGRAEEASSEFDPFAAEAGTRSESGGEPKARQAAATTTSTAPRIWVSEDPERTEQLFEILKSPLPSAGLEFPDGTPLEEIIAFLREEYDVEIVLDTVALDELGIGPDEPISISLRNIRLDQAMRRMLEPLELTYVVDDGVLLVTSEEEALTKLRLAIYDVRDLVSQGDYDSLRKIIVSTIAADTWAGSGSGESEIRAYPQRGAFVVLQTISVHEEIANLLTAMRAMPLVSNAKSLPQRRHEGGSSRGGYQPTNRPTPRKASVSERELEQARQRNLDREREVRSSDADEPFSDF